MKKSKFNESKISAILTVRAGKGYIIIKRTVICIQEQYSRTLLLSHIMVI